MSEKTITTELLLIKTHTTESISPNPQPPKPFSTNMPTVAEPKAVDTARTKKSETDHPSIMSNGVESHDGESEATNEHEENGQTETGEGITAPAEGGEEGEEGQEDEEEGSEAVPIGTVNAEGEVVDSSGNVVGKAEGDVPEGSLVDTEGDVLDTEGNVIGKADVGGAAKDAEGALGEAKDGVEKPDAEGAAEEATEGVEKPGVEGAAEEATEGVEKPDVEGAAEEATEGVEKPDAEGAAEEATGEVEKSDAGRAAGEKPELAGPFGVQDNREVTNAAGVPIGQLAEGDPQDLVGRSIKEVDDEGNLKTEGGSVVGRVELNPEVLNKGQEAAGELGEKASEGEEAADKLEGAKPELDFSILKGMKVNKLGKIVKEDVSIKSFHYSFSHHFYNWGAW